MAGESSAPRQKVPWWFHAFFAFVLALIGGDILAVPCLDVRELSLPFAWLTYFLPALVGGICFAGVLLLRRTRLGRAAWVVAWLLSALPVYFPIWLLAEFTQSIPLTRMLEPEEATALRAKFPHPFVNYSASGEGDRLLVRKSDYDPALLDFLKSIHAVAAPDLKK